jgi:hypothetical protein
MIDIRQNNALKLLFREENIQFPDQDEDAVAKALAEGLELLVNKERSAVGKPDCCQAEMENYDACFHNFCDLVEAGASEESVDQARKELKEAQQQLIAAPRPRLK